MALIKGGFLRLLQTLLYAICFCCAAIILGIYSYFLAVQADHHVWIWQWERAVEGLSGAATLYTIFAVILTCCLGGVAFFSLLALVLDLLFAGAMIAIAVMTRGGASTCNGYVYTPLGNGPSSDGSIGFNDGGADGGHDITYAVSYKTACRLNTACFAVSIVAIIFFIITAFMQLGLIRSHGKEKRFGPGPSNGYTSGTGKRGLFARKSRKNAEKDAELGTTGTAVGGGLAASHHNHNHNVRPSHETGYTGTTTAGSAINNDKYENGATAPATGTHGGYYTQPQGTGVNPYGYENTANTATHNTHNNYTTGTATNY